MSLDLSKIDNLTAKDGKQVGRCPACAEDDGDSKGEHLVIFPDGAYGCVAYEGDEEHIRRIWELVGAGSMGGKNAKARRAARSKLPSLSFEEPRYPKLDERGFAPIKESFDLASWD